MSPKNKESEGFNVDIVLGSSVAQVCSKFF